MTTALRHRLAEVEARLHEVLTEQHSTHLLKAGGKRLRPRLALLGAEFGDPDDPEVVQKVIDAAVITELVHAGTLHHDDVMDQATVRHGVPTANALWGNNLAVLLGDLMLARAAELGAELGLAALRLQATTLSRLVRGQLMESVRPRTDQMAHCLAVMADKSASLFAMSVRLGAEVAGADDWICAALGRYGEHLGIAFQLADDVLDICATESGKDPGTDLRAGVTTVPVLHALAEGDAIAQRLRVILITGAVTDPDLHAEALDLLRRSCGPDRTLADASTHAEKARAELAALPAIPARDVLDGLCDVVRERTV